MKLRLAAFLLLAACPVLFANEDLTQAKDMMAKAKIVQSKVDFVLGSDDLKTVLEGTKLVLDLFSSTSKVFSAVGAILDIAMMFMPKQPSAELRAIKDGFVKMEAQISVLSGDLEDLAARVEWQPIVARLLELESNVNTGIEMYGNLQRYFQDEADYNDTESGKLSLRGKNILEKVIDYVENNNVGQVITEIMTLVRGESAVIEKPLLPFFEDAVDHNCSKILPFAAKLFTILRNAQKLQFLYELNQGFTSFDGSDQEYGEQVYDFLTASAEQLAHCMKNVKRTGEKDISEIFKNGGHDTINEIIKTLNEKYYLYDWAALKELNYDPDDDRNEEHNVAYFSDKITLEVVSEDDVEDKERIIVFMAPKSNVTGSGKESILEKSIAIVENAYFKDKRVTELDETMTELLSNLPTGLIQAMVLFKSQNDKWHHDNWHHDTNITVQEKYWIRKKKGSPAVYGIRNTTLKLLVLFNNVDNNTLNYNCNDGEKIQLSDSLNHPYCVCDIGFGGAHCQIAKNAVSMESGDALYDIIAKYRVPGMFDLQDQIEGVANEVMAEMEKNKDEIFSRMEENGRDIVQNRNAILASESIIMNQCKNESARLLQEFAGLKKAMEQYYTKQRNDIIFHTQQGQDIVFNAVMESTKETTSSILRMEGKIIGNRYFDKLELHLPAFQNAFGIISADSTDMTKDVLEHAKKQFSIYLKNNKHDFLLLRTAIKHAITGSARYTDSLLVAQMKASMTEGCTAQYYQLINSTWSDLIALHRSTYTIELWDIDFKIKQSCAHANESETDSCTIVNEIQHEYWEMLKNTRESEALSALQLFKNVYKTNNCPGFKMPALLGGGCENYGTYPGQKIPLRCEDSAQSVVLSMANEVQAITELKCTADLVWDVNVGDLECVTNCQHEDEPYVPGTLRTLPDPPNGFQWIDETGAVITETKCAISSNVTRGEWSVHQQVDINECEYVSCDNGQCVNSNGSYTCDCDDGFYENSLKVCEDTNECSSGGDGYLACLVGRRLGQCTNTHGNYSCSCLPGAWKPSSSLQSCEACGCNGNGVTRDVCNGTTGQCLCTANVGGNTCDRCLEGYDDFPSCSTCEAGYYGYPNCRSCNCNLEGVSADICNKISGRCNCHPATKYFGSQCSRCCPQRSCDNDYTSFPVCTPIVRHATLTSWSSWSTWRKQGSCNNGAYGVYLTRTRTRTCNENTKNRHGNGCSGQRTIDTERDDSRKCYSISRIQIHLYNSYWAPTTGNLKLKISQTGSSSCDTGYIFHDLGTEGIWYYYYGNGGCNDLFDYTEPLVAAVISDSSNDVYINVIYVYINGGTIKRYVASTYLKIDKHDYVWRTLSNW